MSLLPYPRERRIEQIRASQGVSTRFLSPNIEGNFYIGHSTTGGSQFGAFYQGRAFGLNHGGGGGSGSYIEFSAIRSSSTYGKSSTVQPLSLKILYLIRF